MRVPLLSFVLVLAVVIATVSLVPAVCNGAEATTAGEEHDGSIKPLSWSVDAYGAVDRDAKKPKEQIVDVQGTPKVTADTKQAEKATASAADDRPADKYVAPLVPGAKAEKEKSDESANESAYPKKKEKKVKKEKEEILDYLDDSIISKKEKKEKSDDSVSDELADESASAKKAKKKKKKKTDADSVEDATLAKKEKKKKKKKKEEEEAKKGKESGDSDEATSLKKQKKHKKKKKEEEEEENADEEKPDSDATPVDVSPTNGQYFPSSMAEAKLNEGGERQVSTSSQPMAADSPDEPLPSATSSATADAYPSPKVVSSQSMAADSPDEPLPSAKSSATADAYPSPKVVNSQTMAAGSPDEPLPSAKTSPNQLPWKKPKLSMQAISGMIKQPISKLLSPVIKSVCGKTEFPEDCEASISGLPGAATTAATDTAGVLRLAMEAVQDKVLVAIDAARERIHVKGINTATMDALIACMSSYGDIKSSLDTVDDALKRGDIDTVESNLDAVETDLTTCDDGFQERGTPSVMTDHDQELQKLASDLLSIGAVIKQQKGH